MDEVHLNQGSEEEEPEVSVEETSHPSLPSVVGYQRPTGKHRASPLEVNFKVHIIIAICFSLAFFLCKYFIVTSCMHELICRKVWIIQNLMKSYWLPWFLWVWCFFGMTVSAHWFLFIKEKQVVNCHIAWYSIVNAVLFLTWLRNPNANNNAWFLFPLFIWGILLATHYILSKYRNENNKKLYVHTATFTILNIGFFLLWLSSQGSPPFFVWTTLGFSIPLIVHYCRRTDPSDWFKLHLYLFIDIQLLLFCTWLIVGNIFPWFLFPLVLWSIVLVFHGYKRDTTKNKNSSETTTRMLP